MGDASEEAPENQTATSDALEEAPEVSEASEIDQTAGSDASTENSKRYIRKSLRIYWISPF